MFASLKMLSVGVLLSLALAGPAAANREAQVAVDLTIINATDNNVDVYWVRPNGTLKYFTTLGPQQSALFHTFAGHKWRADFQNTGVSRTFIMPFNDSTWTLD